MKWMVILSLAIVAGVCGPARGALYLENFDGYADQTAFNTIGAWPAGGGFDTGVLSTSQSVSPTKSVSIGTTPQRNEHTIGELSNPSASNSIRFSFDFYDTNASVDPYPQAAAIVDGDGSAVGQLISMGLNDNQDSAGQGGNFYMARIRGFNVSAFFKLNEGGPATLRSTGWHNLAVEVSFVNASTLAYKFFVDDVLARSLPSVTMTAQSFDSVQIGTGASSPQGAFFDNVRVENFNPTAVPEVGSLAMVGLVGLLSAGLAWSRKRMGKR